MHPGNPRRPSGSGIPHPSSRFPQTHRPSIVTNGPNHVVNLNSPFNSPQSPEATTPDALNFYKIRQPQPITNGMQGGYAYPGDSEPGNIQGNRAPSGPVLRKSTSTSSIGQAARSQNASFRDLVARFDRGQEMEGASGTMKYSRSPSGTSIELKDSAGEVFVIPGNQGPFGAPQRDHMHVPNRDLEDPAGSSRSEHIGTGFEKEYDGDYANNIVLPAAGQQTRPQQPPFIPPTTTVNDFDPSTAQWFRPEQISPKRNVHRSSRRASENFAAQQSGSHRPRSHLENSRLPLANTPPHSTGISARSPHTLHKRSVSDFSRFTGGANMEKSPRYPTESPVPIYDFMSGGTQQFSRSRIPVRQASLAPQDGSPRSAKRSRSDYVGSGSEPIRPNNRRSITPPPRLYSVRHDINAAGQPRSGSSHGDRVRAIITAPAVKNSPPLRSSRPRQHVSAVRSRSPTPNLSSQRDSRPLSPDKPVPMADGSDRQSSSPKAPQRGNLLTQLSNAVYPRVAPRLTLDVPILSPLDDQAPLTSNTEFEEDLPLSADMPGKFPDAEDSGIGQRLESTDDGDHQPPRSSPQTQSGMQEVVPAETSGKPEAVLDKIMELRQRSSVLLSGVLGSLPANSPTSPTRSATSTMRGTLGPRRHTSGASGATSPVNGSANSSPVMTRPPTRQSNYQNIDSASAEQSQTLPLREVDSAGTTQVMLGNTPTSDRSTRPWQPRDRMYRSNTESSLTSPGKSFSQSAGTPSMSPSTTTSPMKGGFLRTPSRTTLDSDSYSIINRVLDQYHETGIVSSEMVLSFQQHILDADPELTARSDLDSLSIARVALEELIHDYSSSSLFSSRSHANLRAGQSQSDMFGSDSPYKQHTPKKYEYQPSSVRGMTSVALQNLNPTSSQLYSSQPLEETDMPQNTFASGFRSRHYSIADKVVSNGQPQVIPAPTEDARDDDIGPTPPPKDVKPYNVNSDRQSAIDRRTLPHRIPPRQSSTGSNRSNRRPVLPEIVSTGGGLGLFHTPRPSHESGLGHEPNLKSAPVPSMYDFRASEQLTSGTAPATELTGQRDITASSRTSTEAPPTLPTEEASEAPHNGHMTPTPSVAKPISIQSLDSAVPTASMESASSTIGPDGAPSAEQRRLIKRRHLIKELVDTEFSFNQDMKVIEDIYKGTASAVEALTPDDRRILFGNSAQIVEFSEDFLNTLKQAAASVYVMPRTNKWRLKRGSLSKPPSTHEDQQSVASADGTDDERDKKTYFGEAFGQHIPKMEKVYGDYLRNHDLANQRLAKLQDVPQVSLWLNECHTYASDITSAWDLDSLLVKPVQRILKYPLLLKSLLEVTTSEHPDYAALEIAVKQMMEVSYRINESKKRAELLEQVVKRPAKRKEYDVGVALTKAFGRRNEKLKQQVSLSDHVEDPEYKAISEKFGGQYFQLTVVMKDMENYKRCTEEFIKQYNRYIEAMEEMIDVGHHNNPEMEAKWRRLTLTIREMTAIAYMDHEASVRRYCIDPMATLLKMHDGPQKLMAKRKKHIVEYATYLNKKNRGERLDKKTQEQGEQFIALNETLKDELPKLFSLTAKLVQACLRNYVDIQVQWHSTWQRKIKAMVKEQQIPKDLADIVEAFNADFSYAEAQMQALNLCNGTKISVGSSIMSSTTPTLAGTEESSLMKRPSALTATTSTTSIPGIGLTLPSSPLPNSPTLGHPDASKRRSTASGNFGAALGFNSPRSSMDVNRRSQSSAAGIPLSAAMINATSPQRSARLRAISSASGGKLTLMGLGRDVGGSNPNSPPILGQRLSNSHGQTIAYGPYNERERPATSTNAGTRPTTATSSRSPTLPSVPHGNVRNAAAAAARLSAGSAMSIAGGGGGHGMARTSTSTLYSMPSSIGGVPVAAGGRQRSVPTSPDMSTSTFAQAQSHSHTHNHGHGQGLSHAQSDGIYNSAMPPNDSSSGLSTTPSSAAMARGASAQSVASSVPQRSGRDYTHPRATDMNANNYYNTYKESTPTHADSGYDQDYGPPYASQSQFQFQPPSHSHSQPQGQQLHGQGQGPNQSRSQNQGQGQTRPGQAERETIGGYRILFLAASLFEFNIDRSRKEAGYPYLTYVPGEVFDVIGEKGELWLAKNQDDAEGLVGWIWEKHFAKLMPDGG